MEHFNNDVVAECIKCSDREQLKGINFSVQGDSVDTSSMCERLCNILGNKGDKTEVSSTRDLNTRETRRSRIGFVYALLNLPVSKSNESLIIKNIEIIADQRNKTDDEMRLLDYIFRSEGKFGSKINCFDRGLLVCAFVYVQFEMTSLVLHGAEPPLTGAQWR